MAKKKKKTRGKAVAKDLAFRQILPPFQLRRATNPVFYAILAARRVDRCLAAYSGEPGLRLGVSKGLSRCRKASLSGSLGSVSFIRFFHHDHHHQHHDHHHFRTEDV